MTEQEAEQKINEVCEWLKSNSLLVDPDRDFWAEDPAVDAARAYCHRLLDAANADGLGGCQLCCS